MARFCGELSPEFTHKVSGAPRIFFARRWYSATNFVAALTWKSWNWAASGSDALTQAIESFTSIGASAVTDGLAFEAIRRIARALHVDPRSIGYAGLKDAHAVTEQTISVGDLAPSLIEQLDLDRLLLIAMAQALLGV